MSMFEDTLWLHGTPINFVKIKELIGALEPAPTQHSTTKQISISNQRLAFKIMDKDSKTCVKQFPILYPKHKMEKLVYSRLQYTLSALLSLV